MPRAGNGGRPRYRFPVTHWRSAHRKALIRSRLPRCRERFGLVQRRELREKSFLRRGLSFPAIARLFRRQSEDDETNLIQTGTACRLGKRGGLTYEFLPELDIGS
jgi:hypothetical protein